VFVVENLIANATRAVLGLPGPSVSVDLREESGEAIVTVEDSGKGIAQERQAAVFEEGVSERAGGGHGLAESRRILGTRGGSIRIARSAPGEGAVFEVRFRIVS
jgi:signal transduction histidine kinase